MAAFNSELPHKNPKMISYRNYKHFDRSNFEKEIKNTLILQKQKISLKDFSAFKNTFFEALNLYALLKTKYLLANHSSFISKDLSKAIMHRSKLRNQFLKLQIHESRLRYDKQRNLCVTLLRKAKMSEINDNKKFWKNVRPIFGNKSKGNKNIALEEVNKVITNDGKLAQTFDEYFVNIVPSLGITSFHEDNDNVNNDNIDNIITKLESHPSVVAIKDEMKKYSKTFTFQNVSTDKVTSIIKKLNSKKVSKSDDITT